MVFLTKVSLLDYAYELQSCEVVRTATQPSPPPQPFLQLPQSNLQVFTS